MKTHSYVVLLLALGAFAARGDEPAPVADRGGATTLVRRGGGEVLVLSRHEVRAGDGRVELCGLDGAPDVLVTPERVLARPDSGSTWRRIEGDPRALIPELLGGDPGEGVAVEPAADGRPARVTGLGRGGREVREYGPWTEGGDPPAPDPGDAVSGEAAIPWPPERTFGSPLERELARLEAKAGEVRDLRGRFTREKRTLLLRRPAVAAGSFRFVPGRLLWVDETPRETRVLVTRTGMEILDVANRRLERFRFGDDEIGDHVFLGFGDSLAAGLRPLLPVSFEVGEEETKLVLEVVGGPLAERVKEIRLTLSRETGLLRELGYEDRSGDFVTTRLAEVEKDSGLTEEDVSIDPPPGTKVVETDGGLPWR